EVVQMEKDRDLYTLQVRLRDRFGDLGMIGVVICRADGKEACTTWEIDTWLMSCRVLGRCVEQAMLREVVVEAKRRGIDKIVGVYKATAKNSMVADHYPNLGFRKSDTLGIDPRFELLTSHFSIDDLPLTVESPQHSAASMHAKLEPV